MSHIKLFKALELLHIYIRNPSIEQMKKRISWFVQCSIYGGASLVGCMPKMLTQKNNFKVWIAVL